ncbi:ribitol 5-phosphate transferase FKRP [Drosophila biarmipes]|uniref:ribitol 5-phosphate transferase FKRP n=1 Tax=Drosophila biarmipes TaxID=125945 RepID=UPI0007E88179|nr:ribitol 5-phosphate transferase FKRP [Drosophila biarmipes]
MKVFRLRLVKVLLLGFLLANLVFLYYTWNTLLWRRISKALSGESLAAEEPPKAAKLSPKDKVRNANKHIRKSITIVFYGHYNFEQDLRASIDSILDVIPNMPILVLQDGGAEYAYPPVHYERNLTAGEERTVVFQSLAFDVRQSRQELNPLASIRTKYVLVMPDSVRLSSKNILQKILREINSLGLPGQPKEQRPPVPPDETVRRMVLVPFAGNLKSFISCVRMTMDLPDWTLELVATNDTRRCDLFLQKHAILLDASVLGAMPEPFTLPFPEMLYMQAKIANLSTTVFPQAFQEGRRLFASFHTKQRRMDLRRRQFREMYKRLQIKRIVRRAYRVPGKAQAREVWGQGHGLVLDGQFSSSNTSLPLITDIDLFGCERTTKSCIGSVYNERPYYSYLGKHTPPCCLDKLRTTFNHVLEEFENVGIRYWLDNRALQSAIETNHLSPDAYDIDISFNVQDLERSNAMKKSQSKPYVDNEGFYWIKATDGHYFRVQFSKPNQVGVNLLPYAISGTEAKPSGFFGWKATTFSADYLHPMSTVLFLGKSVMCPNNVLEYLEEKHIKVKSADLDAEED